MNSTKPRGTARIADRRVWNPSISGIENRDGIARQRLRRTSSGWILLLLLLLFLPAVAHAHLDYLVIDGSVKITGHRGTGGDVVIPDTINGLPVTRIGERAWWFNVVSLTIPNSVVSIGEYAFAGWTELKSVVIGDGVVSIGNEAFSDCTGLTAIEVEAMNPTYSSLEGVLFDKGQSRIILCPRSKAGDFTIPNSVTGIAGETFSYCTGLTSVTIPIGVTRIEEAAFYGCTSLTSIIVPDSITSIGDWAFEDCTSLRGVYFEGDAPALGGMMFLGPNKATIYSLPATSGWGTTFGGTPTALWIPITPTLPSPTSTNPLKLVTRSPAPATVRVQRSVNLVDWEDWQRVSRDAGPSELQDTETGGTPYRFYRGIEE